MTRNDARDDSYLDSFLESAFGEESGDHPRASDGATSVAERVAEESDSPPPDILSRYPVAELLGRGGVGLVYRAHDSELGRDVAIKVLARRYATDGEAIARFEEEARIASRLQHPGVVPIHEMGRLQDGRPYFTMKIVAGETLADRLATRQPDHASRALLEIVVRVAQTLAFAHSHGVIHGDVKPQNVMVGAFGEVQLMDWGFARETDALARAADAEMQTRVVGTPSYMAPEQARGDLAAIGPRTDVFGLGAILCEILTGSPPYGGETRSEILLRATKGWIDDARRRLMECRCDPALIELTSSCLDPDSARRPRDASDVAIALQNHLASLEERARAAEVETAKARAAVVHEKRARRLTLLLAAAALLAITVPALLLYSAERAKLRRRELADQAIASTTGRARVLLDQARSSVTDDPAAWGAAVAAGQEVRSLATAPDVSAEASVAARLLADSIDREQAESTKRAAILAKLEELHPHGRVERPEATDRGYVACFRELGCDIDEGNTAETIERFSTLPCMNALVDALDELTLLRFHHKVPTADAWRAPRAIAVGLDADPVRARIRAALADPDRSLLESLAKSASADHDVRTLNLLARSLVESGKLPDAITVYRLASARYPGHYWTHHDLASLLALGKTPKHEEISRIYSMALAVRPNHPHALTDLGRALALAGDNDSAIDLLARAVVIDPGDGRIRLLYGASLSTKGELERARVELSKATELGNGIAIVTLSQIQTRLGEFEAALETLKLVERLPVHDPSLRFEIALRLKQLHRPDLSMRALEPLLAIKKPDPDHIRLSILLAIESGDLDLARRRFESAVATHSREAIDPNGGFESITAQNLSTAARLDSESLDQILEGDVNSVALAALTAQRLENHPAASRLHRELFAFDSSLYRSVAGLLAFSALRSASIVANTPGDADAETSARFAFEIASTILESFASAMNEGTLSGDNVLEVLGSVACLDEFTKLRKERRDDSFESRFESLRNELVKRSH